MQYDFDKIILRNGTNAIKWDGLDKTFGAADILPMWIADMDFEAPQPVIDAVVNRAQHGIYGYTEKPESFYSSISNWMKKRHGWQIDNKWIEVSAGVVPAISLSILSYSEPGDKILLQSPVYYPFFSAIESNNRVIVNNQLIYENHQYTIDFKDLESKLKTGVKVIILCNPHNPVGRVWSRELKNQMGNSIEYVYDRSKIKEKRKSNEIGISSIRGGTIPGEHTVFFAGKDEVIEIKHSALSRDMFGRGAIRAARYTVSKPNGYYTMKTMLEELIQ
jgi:hypothetical protein